MPIGGPASVALASLDPSQIHFLQTIPKAELHAHLGGSIPLKLLKELASEYLISSSNSPLNNTISDDAIKDGITKLGDPSGPALENIRDFFHIFPAIHALTSNPQSLRRAARAVLSEFLDGELPQCHYLELRTTPRQSEDMSRELYIKTVLDEVERYPSDKAALMVSLDRGMKNEVVRECLQIACKLKREGRRIVGLDLCGDPSIGDMDLFAQYLSEARNIGLGLTLHVAETVHNTTQETLKLLSYNPDRLGHATFLNDEATAIVLEKKLCIEICLTSNLLCKTVSSLESHHILQYLERDHPISICTDDNLPFRTSLLGEYALLLAKPPFGLGLSEYQVKKIGQMSMQAKFSCI